MKLATLFGPILSVHLLMATAPAFAHAGHGDEFQATGGVNRVEVKVETDSLLGIQVSPIEPAEDGSGAVLVPATALVDDGGRQLVFVQYESFYEPVEVSTGETQGELIEVTEGLSVGEQLVTGGGLSLYAESRKTQTAEAEDATAEAEAIAVATKATDTGAIRTATTDTVSPEQTEIAQGDEAHDQAHAEGIPHSHDSGSGSLKALIGTGVGVALVGALLAFFVGKRGGKGEAL